MCFHPNNNLLDFTEAFHSTLEKLIARRLPCFTLGDFNINLLCKNYVTQFYINAITSLGAYSLLDIPTRVIPNGTAALLDRLYTLMQGWPTSQRSRATFVTVLPYRASSHTCAHMDITPFLPHSHAYFFSARFSVNITHQHDNDRA